MKKMTTQVQCWKKHLYNDYIKKNKTLDFNSKNFIKLWPFWYEFVRFKTSEEGQEQARRMQENAQHKTYHHRMGSGGYPTAIPKWEKAKQELIDTVLEPESVDWPKCTKHWFFTHKGSLGLETRKVMYGECIQAVVERFHQDRSIAQSGQWQPNRDKDELTYALRNPKHDGRTRGYGSVSWEHAFPQDRETYRSDKRKKMTGNGYESWRRLL
jgi:hypothetical protein